MSDVRWLDGRPVVVLEVGEALVVAELVERIHAQHRHRGGPVVSEAVELVAACRQVVAMVRVQRLVEVSASARGSVRGVAEDSGSEWLSTSVVAGLVGITPRAVRLRAARGAFPGAKKIETARGDDWVIPVAALAEGKESA